jgi:hypothetical protein
MSKNVAFIRKEIRSLMPLYRLIRDCLSGSETVKAQRTKYLPMPNPTNKSPENIARYDQYLLRAVFYNVTRRTLIGLVGQVFSRDPVVNLPKEMDKIIKNATGGGVTLNQLSKKSLAMTLAYSRRSLILSKVFINESTFTYNPPSENIIAAAHPINHGKGNLVSITVCLFWSLIAKYPFWEFSQI